MSDTPPSDDVVAAPIGLAQMFVQLRDDATGFVTAEARYLKAQAGERASYAKPALIALGAGLAIALGAMIALPVGLVLVLAPLIGAGSALVAVTAGGLAIGGLLVWSGSRRLARALKAPEDR